MVTFRSTSCRGRVNVSSRDDAQLKSALWNAANTLRGSAVDRTDWKGYILPLLFFKRISDVWDEETAEKLTSVLGSFLGECIRRNYGGDWQMTEIGRGLAIAITITIFTIEAVFFAAFRLAPLKRSLMADGYDL